MKHIATLLFAAFAGFSSQLLADPGQYQIELIIFSQNLPTTEVFSQSSSEIQWPTNLYEQSDYQKPDSLTLAPNYTAIASNTNYQPLLHTAWIQKIGDRDSATSVHVNSPDGRINGFISVQRNQSILLTADLEYSPGGGNSGLVYRLNDNRQINLDELNYLDHPKFGVIAKVTAK